MIDHVYSCDIPINEFDVRLGIIVDQSETYTYLVIIIH